MIFGLAGDRTTGIRNQQQHIIISVTIQSITSW